MGNDWVAIGSYITVALTCVILVVLAIKGYKLIYKNDNK